MGNILYKTFNLGIRCHNSSSSSSSHKECTQCQVQLLCACLYCTGKIKIVFTVKNRVEHHLQFCTSGTAREG
jgi:hypothetical protein